MGLGSLLAVGLVCSMGKAWGVLEVRRQEVTGPSSATMPEQVPVLRVRGQPAEGLPVSHDARLILLQGFETLAQAEVTTSLHFPIPAPDLVQPVPEEQLMAQCWIRSRRAAGSGCLWGLMSSSARHGGARLDGKALSLEMSGGEGE